MLSSEEASDETRSEPDSLGASSYPVAAKERSFLPFVPSSACMVPTKVPLESPSN